MSNIAIHCESLSKRYRIGERPTNSFREALMNRLTTSLRRGHKRTKGNGSTMWALRDISVEIRESEVVGIIGRNGAGKSTLLKVLSRITEPTQGFAEVRGRVGSLLEVGTGFHHELTGRENIYLNGAILGMRKAEIARKFDEIVAFAEIEKFLDTPVKRYSSGMYVRLAFAVAAHLETEILLVDEVLAVGDAQFQKKCFEKVRSVGQSGRTILFVSHNMAALRQVCKRAIALESGGIVADGEINDVADKYLASVQMARATGMQAETPTCIVRDVQIRSLSSPVIKTFDRVEVRVRFTAKTAMKDPGIYVSLLTLDGQRIAGVPSNDLAHFAPLAAGESVEMGFVIEDFPLLAGAYDLEVQLRDAREQKYEFVPAMFRFTVVETPVYGQRKTEGGWFGNVGLQARAFCATFDGPAAGQN
ncbi:MAG: ABC transporter ATP-binding protein [Terriglobales bacterium]